jgi:hypothetical protein
VPGRCDLVTACYQPGYVYPAVQYYFTSGCNFQQCTNLPSAGSYYINQAGQISSTCMTGLCSAPGNPGGALTPGYFYATQCTKSLCDTSVGFYSTSIARTATDKSTCSQALCTNLPSAGYLYTASSNPGGGGGASATGCAYSYCGDIINGSYYKSVLDGLSCPTAGCTNHLPIGFYFSGPGGPYPNNNATGCPYLPCLNAPLGSYYTTNGLTSAQVSMNKCGFEACPSLRAGLAYVTAGTCHSESCSNLPRAGSYYVALPPYTGCDYVPCDSVPTVGTYFSDGCTTSLCDSSVCNFGASLVGCGGNSSGVCVACSNGVAGSYWAVKGSCLLTSAPACPPGMRPVDAGVPTAADTMRCYNAPPLGMVGASAFCVGFEPDGHVFSYGSAWGVP